MNTGNAVGQELEIELRQCKDKAALAAAEQVCHHYFRHALVSHQIPVYSQPNPSLLPA